MHEKKLQEKQLQYMYSCIGALAVERNYNETATAAALIMSGPPQDPPRPPRKIQRATWFIDKNLQTAERVLARQLRDLHIAPPSLSPQQLEQQQRLEEQGGYTKTNGRSCSSFRRIDHIIEMAPSKHRVDDGLEICKSAFECMYTLLEKCRDKVEIFVFIDRILVGLTGQPDIQMLCHLTLTDYLCWHLVHNLQLILAGRLRVLFMDFQDRHGGTLGRLQCKFQHQRHQSAFRGHFCVELDLQPFQAGERQRDVRIVVSENLQLDLHGFANKHSR
ncbi:MAG: TATA-binding protein interacting-domain-containing protein [Benniella sp.]|nr:MAG: TATA-binding protein interacting-domain-containing protein [Benniella sp.]